MTTIQPLSLESAIHEPGKQQLWEHLEDLYKRQRSTIDLYTTLDVRKSTPTTLDAVIGGFNEAAKVVLDGLVVLGNIHPVVSAAVVAFHLVISLDLKRRENNKKVLVVKVQMQSMMCVLFQLREMKSPPEAGITNDSLSNLIKDISEDIIKCANECDYYLKKKPLSKYIKSFVYENRFSEHIEHFSHRRDELNLQLQAYLASRLDSVDEKIESIQMEVAGIKDEFWRAFRSNREKDVLDYIGHCKVNTKSDINDCIADEHILKVLLTKSGEDLPSYDDDTQRAQDERRAIRGSILKELTQDLVTEFKQNMASFEGKLKLQNESLQLMNNRLEQVDDVVQENSKKLDDIQVSIKEEGKTILKALAQSRYYEHIKDQEMKRIWKEMGLGTSVKARHFILTLRDHFMAITSNANTAPSSPWHTSGLLLGTSVPEQNSQYLKPSLSVTSINHEDIWALQYLDASHFRQIMEAIDQDNSGFISVKEANRFSLAKPEGWSLLQWFAYWAAGWEITCLSYRARIYHILRHMHAIVKRCLPDNRPTFDQYLDNKSLLRVELLLRSINVSYISENKKILKIAEEFMKIQENTIVRNLEKVHYLIDSEETLALVVGQDRGRIEFSILCLINLLLKHHLAIFNLSVKRSLPCGVMYKHIKSFTAIFSVFDMRMSKLEAIFHQTRQNPRVYFETYASGMFLTSYKHTIDDFWQTSIDSRNNSDIDDYDYFGGITDSDDSDESEEGLGITEDSDDSDEDEDKDEDEDHEDEDEDNKEYNANRARILLEASGKMLNDPSKINDPGLVACLPKLIIEDFRLYMRNKVRMRARALWFFAISTALAQGRSQKWSWNSIQVGCQIRRLWIMIMTEHKHENTQYWFPKPMSEENTQILLNMRRVISTESAALYDELVEHLFDRGLHRRNHVRCDLCGKSIFWTRYQCITCSADDLSDQVDLCSSCLNKDLQALSAPSEFSHERSHSLIRTGIYVQKPMHKSMVLRGKEMSNRIKSAFRAQEMSSSGERTTSMRKLPMACKSCCKPVKIPCFVCVICSPDHFYCGSCVYDGFPVLINREVHEKYSLHPSHDDQHPLLRICDSVEVKERKDGNKGDRAEKKLIALEKSIGTMEACITKSVNAQMDDLRTKMDEGIDTTRARIEDRIESLEAKIERLTTLLERIVPGDD